MTQLRIPKDIRRYILDSLRFAPVEKRKLDQHMRRQADYGNVMLSLFASGLVAITGSGVKGSPIMYRLVAGDQSGDALAKKTAIVSPNI